MHLEHATIIQEYLVDDLRQTLLFNTSVKIRRNCSFNGSIAHHPAWKNGLAPNIW
jgi:hypothetical protein